MQANRAGDARMLYGYPAERANRIFLYPIFTVPAATAR